MYCMGVDHVELMVMLLLVCVKHLLSKPESTFWISQNTSHTPPKSKLVTKNPRRGVDQEPLTPDPLRGRDGGGTKSKCRYFKTIIFLYVGQ